MNKLLQRQLQKHFGKADQVPENFNKLLHVISESYDHYEKDRKMIERSIELSSKEMIELNSQIKKSGKDELQKVHNQLKALFENIEEVLYSVDMVSLKILQISAACEKVYGYTSAEFFADRDLWQKVILPEDIHIVHKHFKDLYEGKQVTGQYRILHKDKSIRWLESKVIPTLDEAGQLIRMDGVTNDISERKRAEKELEEGEKRLRQIIDLVPHFIFGKDINGKFTIVNEAVAKAYGSTVDAIVGKTDADFNSNTKEVEHFIQKDFEVINSGIAKHDIEETITGADGNIRILSTTKIPYKSLTGPGLLGVSVDISDRKKAEKIVKESESRLALATQIAKLGYWEFDVIKGLFTFNDQFYSLFKTTAEKVGSYIMDPQRYAELFVFPDDRNFVNAEIARTISALESGFNNKIEHRMIYANGEVGWISVNFFLIKNDEGVTIKTFGVNQDITDRKKAEEALSNNELRFRTLTSNAPVGIFQTDVNGKTSYVNETWLRYTGMEMNEALGEGWTAAVHPDDRNELIEEWNSKSKKGLKSSSEYRLINKEGNIRWVSGEAIPLFNNTREITGYIGTLSDITERKKADEALRLAQFTIENTTHAIYWIKSDGSFHMVNNAATQMLGFSFEELMQLNVPGIDPFYNKEVWDGFWQAIIQQKYMRLITKHIRKDGTLIDVQIDTHYFRFENLEMSCAFVSDITEMKIAETLLKSSEEKYRQIVETAQEGIWLIDENNYVTFVNKKMCEILGYSANEIKGKRLFDFMDEEGKGKALQNIKKTRESVTGNYDVQYITKTGKPVWTNISTNSILDQDGTYKGALAMVTDITQRKLQEELLQKSEVNLEIKNKELELKNKELEQFAYVASHDLQEPLRTTSSFAELLQQQYKGKLDEKADKYLTFISQSSDRMKVLIKDLLDYSRIGAKKEKEKVDCNTILQEVLADLGVAIKETNTEINLGFLPVFNGYPTEIKLLFQNLIINAIKFRKKDISPQIKIDAVRNNGHWEFMCNDNGIGISKEHSERIFIIFQRLHTRNEYEGSGIGLAHCKKIVELHGGKISVESTPGNGSIFYFTIPVSAAPVFSKQDATGSIQQNNIEYTGIKSTE